MRLRVFSVYDRAVGLFMQPIFMRSEAEAVRAIRMIGSDHVFRTSPNDYALFDLGEFDESSGAFIREADAPPRRVADLVALIGE